MSVNTPPSGGKLEDLSVNRLLQMIMEDSSSGSLTVSRGRTSRKLYVKSGMIIYAASTESQDRLGEIFVAQGKLTSREVEGAFKRGKKQNAQLGMVLLVEGRITSQDLFLGVMAQVITILERMRSWRKGDFTFLEGEEPEAGTVLLRIPLSLYLGKKKRQPGRTGGEEEPGAPTAAGESGEVESAGAGMAPGEEEEPEAFTPPEWQEISLGEGGEKEELPESERTVDGIPAEAVIPEEQPDEEEDRRLVEEISFQVQELRRREGTDSHTLLGIRPTAGPEEVQEAYHYLAKLLHPDQHPRGLPADVAEEAEKLFREIAAAYQELHSPRVEPEPEPEAEEQPPQAPKVQPGRVAPPKGGRVADESAARLYYRAKDLVAKGNYWQAADTMRQVVRRKPRDARYRNLLGICLMQTGRRLHEAEEHIREAIRLDPGNPDYVANLGLVYKSGRFYKKARDMFQQALHYDKKHQLSRHELRKLPRTDEPGKRSGGGFWKKLFG